MTHPNDIDDLWTSLPTGSSVDRLAWLIDQMVGDIVQHGVPSDWTLGALRSAVYYLDARARTRDPEPRPEMDAAYKALVNRAWDLVVPVPPQGGMP